MKILVGKEHDPMTSRKMRRANVVPILVFERAYLELQLSYSYITERIHCGKCSSMHPATPTVWTPHDDDLLRSAVRSYGIRRWDSVAAAVPNWSQEACAARWYQFQSRSRTRQPWSAEEDECLRDSVTYEGASQWAIVASFLPGRTAKQCRDRWRNQLDPTINCGVWTDEEDEQLVALHDKFANSWTRIAAQLPGRTDNAVKNRWHSAQFRNRDCRQERTILSPPRQVLEIDEEELRAIDASVGPVATVPHLNLNSSCGTDGFDMWACLTEFLADEGE